MVFIVYTYIYIDILRGLFLLFYIVPMICAYETVENNKSRWGLIRHGLIYSVIALVCQEYFGHYLGGDDPSRPEAVPMQLYMQYIIQLIIYGNNKKKN